LSPRVRVKITPVSFTLRKILRAQMEVNKDISLVFMRVGLVTHLATGAKVLVIMLIILLIQSSI
jgi:hypothetical protein